MPAMVDEYMFWKEKLGDKGMSEAMTTSSSEGVEGTMRLHVIDAFREFLIYYILVTDSPYQRHIHSKSSSVPLIRGFLLPSCVMAASPALLSLLN